MNKADAMLETCSLTCNAFLLLHTLNPVEMPTYQRMAGIHQLVKQANIHASPNHPPTNLKRVRVLLPEDILGHELCYLDLLHCKLTSRSFILQGKRRRATTRKKRNVEII